jgi:phage tail P2-like protein
MTSLLPPSATALTKAIATVNASMFNIPMLHRAFLSPDECPAHLLAWLAWERSVDIYKESWTDAQKREAIRNSPAIHRRKGTVAAIRAAINSVGGTGVRLTEWFDQTPPGTPGTFTVTVEPAAGATNTKTFQTDLIAAITAANRISGHFTLNAAASGSTSLAATGTARAATLINLVMTTE